MVEFERIVLIYIKWLFFCFMEYICELFYIKIIMLENFLYLLIFDL